MTGYPHHVYGVAAYVMDQSPELAPQLAEVVRGCGPRVIGLVPSLLELEVVRDNGDVVWSLVPEGLYGCPELTSARTGPRETHRAIHCPEHVATVTNHGHCPSRSG